MLAPAPDESRPSPAALREDPLVEDNVRSLEQAMALLEGLPAQEYAAASRSGSTVGAHFRHVLDHYLCFFEGLESGLLHYEGRRRDPRVEAEIEIALALGRAIVGLLNRLSTDDLQRPVRVRCRVGELAEQVHGDHPSSVPRELHFVLLHAVHHYGFIAHELRGRGHAVDPDFGLAPATRAWRASRA